MIKERLLSKFQLTEMMVMEYNVLKTFSMNMATLNEKRPKVAC